MVLAVNGCILWNVRDEIVQYDIDKLIGACALVNKRIPSYSTYAGNPARILRENVEWFRE